MEPEADYDFEAEVRLTVPPDLEAPGLEASDLETPRDEARPLPAGTRRTPLPEGAEFEYALSENARAVCRHAPLDDPSADPAPHPGDPENRDPDTDREDERVRSARSRVRVSLSDMAPYARCLWKGREIELFYGERSVGSARILSVQRAVLDADSKSPIPDLDGAAVVCAMVGELRRSGADFRQQLGRLRLGDTLPRIGRAELIRCLVSRPDWVDAWYRWAEEHRLRTGPFLFRYEKGGWAGFYECSGVAIESVRFEDPARACAEFLALELEDSGPPL